MCKKWMVLGLYVNGGAAMAMSMAIPMAIAMAVAMHRQILLHRIFEEVCGTVAVTVAV
jgi:hypothetical protein